MRHIVTVGRKVVTSKKANKVMVLVLATEWRILHNFP